MDIAAFRAAFPEFTAANGFPDAAVVFWSGLAENHLDIDRWGNLYTQGLYLLTAHYLSLSKFMAAGATTGLNSFVASKKVGDVQVNYQNIQGQVTGAGQYNQTPYGLQYWQLVQMVGMGAYQL